MIPEVKVNHWKWCEVQGNSPHERWEWCEVNEEVDVYTALWLDKVQNIDFGKYIIDLSQTEWAKNLLYVYYSYQDVSLHDNEILNDEGYMFLEGILFGISYEHKFENIDEKLYTNEND
jgi:hypothetical protein